MSDLSSRLRPHPVIKLMAQVPVVQVLITVPITCFGHPRTTMFRSIIVAAAVAVAPVATASDVAVEHGISASAASLVAQQDLQAPFDLALSTGSRRLLAPWVRHPCLHAVEGLHLGAYAPIGSWVHRSAAAPTRSTQTAPAL